MIVKTVRMSGFVSGTRSDYMHMCTGSVIWGGFLRKANILIMWKS